MTEEPLPGYDIHFSEEQWIRVLKAMDVQLRILKNEMDMLNYARQKIIKETGFTEEVLYPE